LLGFAVQEPAEYKGEWDIQVCLPDGRVAIGEIEGAEKLVDVAKYRQLLDYVNDEVMAGRDPKGILIGNGFRKILLSERGEQFSAQALRAVIRSQFCAIQTSELFSAVCAVLENPNDEALKLLIRESILKTNGEWKFAK
jgi:hypothetical protein